MNILITGGSGYIASNLMDDLTAEGNISFTIIDKKNGMHVEEFNYFKEFTHIVHLAAIPSVKECNENFNQAVMDNISSTFHLFNEAYKRNIPVIFASSCSAQSPRENFYATTKRIGELEAIRLNKKGANIKILRFSNVYGGKNYLGNKTSVISRFYKDKILTINGDGTQTRDFINVSSICRCIILALRDSTTINDPIIVGTGINTSILELAKMFNKEYIFDPESKFVGINESPSYTYTAKKLLGFKASIKLESYIKSISQ